MKTLRPVFAAAFGAVIGSGLRFLVNEAIPRTAVVVGDLQTHSRASSLDTDPSQFPWSTFTVNVIGACLIGVCAFLPIVADHELRRVFLVTGILGGFTTFSALALDAVTLSNPLLSAFYVGATFVVGLFATHIGAFIARRAR